MSDVIERIKGMLWCYDRVAVPVEIRQTTIDCLEIAFRTNREVPTLIAGVAITIVDNGDVLLCYHGPAVDRTQAKILGNVFHNWEKKPVDDE